MSIPDKEARLRAAGYSIGHAEDFLGLDDVERRLVDVRVKLAREVRRKRAESGSIHTESSEDFGQGEGLDSLFRAYFAAGGTLQDLARIE